MKLSQVMDVWDVLHVKDTGDIGYCDLLSALEEVGVEIESDCSNTSEIKMRLQKT